MLALLTSSGQIQVWHIYVGRHFLSGAVGIFDAPARTAMIPALVSAEQLASAYALNITWRQIATLGGPFIGGIVIGALGLGTAYYIDAISFLAVIICLASCAGRSSRQEPKESPLQSVRVGFDFVRDNSVILALMSMDTCVQFFGAYRSMMPAFARDILGVGPTGMGALLGVPALGALAGSGLILGLGNPKRKGQLIITVTLLYTIGLICFALSRSLALSLLIVFCLGLVDAIGETLRDTLVAANHAGPHARPGKKLRSSFHVRGDLHGPRSNGHRRQLYRRARRAHSWRLHGLGRGAARGTICPQVTPP